MLSQVILLSLFTWFVQWKLTNVLPFGMGKKTLSKVFQKKKNISREMAKINIIYQYKVRKRMALAICAGKYFMF